MQLSLEREKEQDRIFNRMKKNEMNLRLILVVSHPPISVNILDGPISLFHDSDMVKPNMQNNHLHPWQNKPNNVCRVDWHVLEDCYSTLFDCHSVVQVGFEKEVNDYLMLILDYSLLYSSDTMLKNCDSP